MEIALLVALIATNLLWLGYLFTRDEREKDERRVLLNRLAEPRIVEPPKRAFKAMEKEMEEVFGDSISEPEQSEYAAVGRIDPHLLRPDEKD